MRWVWVLLLIASGAFVGGLVVNTIDADPDGVVWECDISRRALFQGDEITEHVTCAPRPCDWMDEELRRCRAIDDVRSTEYLNESEALALLDDICHDRGPRLDGYIGTGSPCLDEEES